MATPPAFVIEFLATILYLGKLTRRKSVESFKRISRRQIKGYMTEISSLALITSFFLRGANERNTR